MTSVRPFVWTPTKAVKPCSNFLSRLLSSKPKMESATGFAKQRVSVLRLIPRHPINVFGFLSTVIRPPCLWIPAANRFLSAVGGSPKAMHPYVKTSRPRLFISLVKPKSPASLNQPLRLCDCWTLFVAAARLSLKPYRPSLNLPQAGIRRHPAPLPAKSSTGPAPFKKYPGPHYAERSNPAGRCLRVRTERVWSATLWNQFKAPILMLG